MNVLNTLELGEQDGFKLTAKLFLDEDTYPQLFDNYDEDDIESYESGDWKFVGVVVTASVDGHEFGNGAIWGTEDGRLAGQNVNAFDMISVYGLDEDALSEARESLAHLANDTVGAV